MHSNVRKLRMRVAEDLARVTLRVGVASIEVFSWCCVSLEENCHLLILEYNDILYQKRN